MSERNTQYVLSQLLESKELVQVKSRWTWPQKTRRKYRIDVDKLRMQTLHPMEKKGATQRRKRVQPSVKKGAAGCTQSVRYPPRNLSYHIRHGRAGKTGQRICTRQRWMKL